MTIRCDRCRGKLLKPGALVFSPPKDDEDNIVRKYHLCTSCWNKLDMEFF